MHPTEGSFQVTDLSEVKVTWAKGFAHATRGHDPYVQDTLQQSTQIGKAIFSVFWSHLNHSISWRKKRFVGFIAIDIWIQRRLMVG